MGVFNLDDIFGKDFVMKRFWCVLVVFVLMIFVFLVQKVLNKKLLVFCGFKVELMEEFFNNVVDDLCCFEICIYKVNYEKIGMKDFVGDIDMFYQCFCEEEVVIFEKYGVEILGVFQSFDDFDIFVWMFVYENCVYCQEVWKVFVNDFVWKVFYVKYKVLVKLEVYMFSVIDYLKLKQGFEFRV